MGIAKEQNNHALATNSFHSEIIHFNIDMW